MAVAIRMSRLGRTHRPFYRVVAIDERAHREGRAIEILGTYDPLLTEKNLQVDIEKIHSWIHRGAQVSESLTALLQSNGYEAAPTSVKESATKQAAKKKKGTSTRQKQDGKTWKPVSRRAKKAHEAKGKAEHMAKLTEEKTARDAAKAKAEADAAAKAEAKAAETPAEDARAEG